jgi:2-haloacid dehalogenase
LQALVFDGFAIFDPRPIARRCEALFPGRGAELMTLWRTRQFEYTWLRTLGARYVDFLTVTDHALTFALAALELELGASDRSALMGEFMRLSPWPDVVATLRELRARGVRLGFVTNFSHPMLASLLRSTGLDSSFEHPLSTDLAQAYKPDPRAYQLAERAFALKRERIGYVAFGGWDAAGAKWFGFPTYWSNRLGTPPEMLDVTADVVAPDLSRLLSFVGA